MTDRAQGWRIALYSGLMFGILMGLFTAVRNGWLPPKSAGDTIVVLTTMIENGTFFGLFIALFMMSGIIPKAEDMPLEAGEVLEYTGFANHFLNFEGRGGRMALTQSHLIFKPHVVNIQRSELRIALSDIAKAEATLTWGLLPNGLAVTLKSGKVEKFVVNNRETWVAKIGKR